MTPEEEVVVRSDGTPGRTTITARALNRLAVGIARDAAFPVQEELGRPFHAVRVAGLGRAAEMFFARERIEIDQLANDHGVGSEAAESAARPTRRGVRRPSRRRRRRARATRA